MKYIIDIDGTLLNSTAAQPGAVDFINGLNESGQKYLLMTNSIKDRSTQVERLEKGGIYVEQEKILSPVTAINQYIQEKNIQRVKIVGSEEEKQILADYVTKDYEMVILLDFEKDNKAYNDLQDIVADIDNGVKVITASISPFYLKNGIKRLDTGAFVRILEDVTNKKIENFGKPSKRYFTIAGKILNEIPENICVIGDDWSTDILGADEYGAKSILVKSGKYQINDETRCNPDIVVNYLGEIEKSK